MSSDKHLQFIFRGVRSTMTSTHHSRRPQIRSLLKWNKMRSLLKWNMTRLWTARRLNCLRWTLSRIWLHRTVQKPRKQRRRWPASHRSNGQPLLARVSAVSGTTRLISRAWLLSMSICHQDWCHLRVRIGYRSRRLARARRSGCHPGCTTWVFLPPPVAGSQIGRASCRERV